MRTKTPANRAVRLILVPVFAGFAMLATGMCRANDKPASSESEIGRVETLIPTAGELLLKLQNDPLRPRYHFMPPWGWMNDPNGPIFWKGRYHLFYQFNPKSAYWERIQWGHASSKDLVHWTHYPIALAPEDGKPDRDGCFSGCAVVNNGTPTLVYMGVPEGVCIATSSDDELIHWTKYPHNPVIACPGPNETREYKVYDPCVWKRGESWYALTGWGRNFARPTAPEGDIAFLFRSADLVHWEYLHPFYKSDRRWTDADEDCAVPDFFPLGDRHVLLFASHKRGAQYYVGRYENDRFEIERHGRLTWTGGQLIAPISMLDDKGRRIFFGWVNEGRGLEAHRAAGWAGVMTIPRVLTLATDGKEPVLRMAPVPEIESLRINHRRTGGIELGSDSEVAIREIRGDCLEIQLEMTPEGARRFGLAVRASPDGAEQTRIFFDTAAGQVGIDGTRAARVMNGRPQVPFLPAGEKEIQVQGAPFELSAGEPLRLRVFLDRSVIEVFVNGRQSLTQRIYPTQGDSMEVRAFSDGGRARVDSIEAWDMAAAGSF